MKLETLKSTRTVECPRDALPGTQGYVIRSSAAAGEQWAERGVLLSQRGNEPEDRAIVQLDSGHVTNVRRRAFRVQVVEHPIWQGIESVSEPNKVYVVCRTCKYTGRVVIAKEKAKGQAATGVPCPNCEKHHLQRIK
ncbi:MAG: hypothetical protein ACYC26_11080 [Phycisphaerales bacterium]